jgi:hypothetical protein
VPATCADVLLRATDAGGLPRHAAALRSVTETALQEIPLYLELARPALLEGLASYLLCGLS